MQGFPDPTPLENGLTWTAEYRGHDWARKACFYFIITLRRGAETVGRVNVEVGDYAYGDPTCRLTPAEILLKLRRDLHDLALAGESNTEALL